MSKCEPDDGTDRSINGSEANGPKVWDEFRGLLKEPRVQVYKGDPGGLKNRQTAISFMNIGAWVQGRKGNMKNRRKHSE